ncbi:MAG: hypothetical protein MZU84_03905 [Sphingobacterium sp.]|nr:hypothetical protein [Sphingobacterium sp.]
MKSSDTNPKPAKTAGRHATRIARTSRARAAAGNTACRAGGAAAATYRTSGAPAAPLCGSFSINAASSSPVVVSATRKVRTTRQRVARSTSWITRPS